MDRRYTCTTTPTGEASGVPFTIPNIITWIRISLIPIFIVFYYLPFPSSHLIAAFIFACAAFTDWLDGYLARSLNQISPFGAFLDPVADKLIVAAALILIVSNTELPYLALPAIVIVGREIVISALREWMAEIGKRASVAVSVVGKIKTAVQMFALILLLIGDGLFHPYILPVGYVLIYASAILTLWSMLMYLKAAWPELVST